MTFFPALNKDDFRNEAHRLEFESWNDPKTPLNFKGAVYEEMKGAMSNAEHSFI